MKFHYRQSFVWFLAALLAVLSYAVHDFGPFFQSKFQKTPPHTTIQTPDTSSLSEETLVYPQTMAETAQIYKGITMNDIPHIFVETLPPDWKIKNNEDKTLFMKIITAQILRTNARILEEKKQLRILEDKYLKNQPWTLKEEEFFKMLLKKYDVFISKKRGGQLRELHSKVDIIPPSLAVVQATFFSDWGQKNQHAPYGEYAWINNEYQPRQFKTLSEATDSFALQLNSRSQLFQFHEQRQIVIPYQKNRYISHDILSSLSQFMDWDKEYIDKLIKTYSEGYFLQLDHASFRPSEKNLSEAQKNETP